MIYRDWDDDALLDEELYLWRRLRALPSGTSPKTRRRYRDDWRPAFDEVSRRNLKSRVIWPKEDAS